MSCFDGTNAVERIAAGEAGAQRIGRGRKRLQAAHRDRGDA